MWILGKEVSDVAFTCRFQLKRSAGKWKRYFDPAAPIRAGEEPPQSPNALVRPMRSGCLEYLSVRSVPMKSIHTATAGRKNGAGRHPCVAGHAAEDRTVPEPIYPVAGKIDAV
ncbi:hypothetical protein [Rhizobium lusitanum]|uniref:hypothetical protein n=1 Tax=Rhizobium lusitanum TaxID=293958 RepID=UPI001957252B|nr:hypothetical protein [Rhizobium lusitanum]MBM7044009.1 hypothetical protein [Rhizobium lusitanum]